MLADSFPGSSPYEGYNYGSFGTCQCQRLSLPTHSLGFHLQGSRVATGPLPTPASPSSPTETSPRPMPHPPQRTVPGPQTAWGIARALETCPTATRVSEAGGALQGWSRLGEAW